MTEDINVLSIKEVLTKFPFFTKWSLRVAMVKYNLPYFRLGRRIFFVDTEVKNWIYNNIVYNITVSEGGQNAKI